LTAIPPAERSLTTGRLGALELRVVQGRKREPVGGSGFAGGWGKGDEGMASL